MRSSQAWEELVPERPETAYSGTPAPVTNDVYATTLGFETHFQLLATIGEQIDPADEICGVGTCGSGMAHRLQQTALR